MRKITIVFISIISAIVLYAVIYYYLPFQVKYQREIRFGDKLVEKIEKFRIENDSIPLSDDYDILSSFGFEHTESFLPIYNKINAADYLIIYCWGFDPPWLFFYSKNKKWEYGFNFPYPEK